MRMMKFNPETGKPLVTPHTLLTFCNQWPHIDFKFDPWTGELRDRRCMLSEPMASDEEQAWNESLRAASSPAAPTAPDILTAAAKHMADRAKTYDKPGGERSMGQTVAAFNAVTGRDLQESEGWLLMQILKDVRDRQRAEPHVDSLEDCVAYAALKAEARMGGR